MMSSQVARAHSSGALRVEPAAAGGAPWFAAAAPPQARAPTAGKRTAKTAAKRSGVLITGALSVSDRSPDSSSTGTNRHNCEKWAPNVESHEPVGFGTDTLGSKGRPFGLDLARTGADKK